MSTVASTRVERTSDAPKSTRRGTQAKAKAPPTPEHDGGTYPPLAMLDDARAMLDKMTALTAYIHADPEANGANDKYLAEFNASAVELAGSIEFLKELLVFNGVTALAEVPL